MSEELEMNLTKEEVTVLSNLFPWKPMYNKLVITLNKTEDDNSMNFENHVLDQEQYVVAVGTTIRDIKAGDKILLNIEKMLTKEHLEDNVYDYVQRIKIEPIEFEGRTFALIDDRVINAVENN